MRLVILAGLIALLAGCSSAQYSAGASVPNPDRKISSLSREQMELDFACQHAGLQSAENLKTCYSSNSANLVNACTYNGLKGETDVSACISSNGSAEFIRMCGQRGFKRDDLVACVSKCGGIPDAGNNDADGYSKAVECVQQLKKQSSN